MISRVLFCVAFVHFIGSSWSDRAIIWGADRLVPSKFLGADSGQFWMPINWATRGLSSIDINLLAPAAMLVALAFALFGTRALALLFALMVWTFHSLNDVVLDGGDNLLAIVVFFLPLMQQPALVTLQGRWSRRRSPARFGFPQRQGEILTSLHNTALLVVISQVAIVYATAGLWKWASPAWRSGQALSVVMQTKQFNYTGWSVVETLARSPLGHLLTWGVVLLQSLAPIGLAHRRSRSAWVIALMAMHAGIAILMGLFGFALVLIAADVLLLSLGARRQVEPEEARRYGLLDRFWGMVGIEPRGGPIGIFPL